MAEHDDDADRLEDSSRRIRKLRQDLQMIVRLDRNDLRRDLDAVEPQPKPKLLDPNRPPEE